MASNSVTILAIDGGGIRGIIPAYILSQSESDLNSQCFQLFDVIGGTSTGGIISAGLNLQFSCRFIQYYFYPKYRPVWITALLRDD